MNNNNEILISRLKEKGLLHLKELEDAFRTIDRADFVPEDYRVESYEDYPLPIGFGQTISQPTTVAFMLELLDLKNGDKTLDVGSGSGWTTALVAEMIKPRGKVWGLEIIPELVELGRKNLAKFKLPNAEIFQAGEKLGFPDRAPYDKILVSAEAEELPKDLLEQLKIGGIIVIPIKNTLYKIEKLTGGKTKETIFPGFVFVPLMS
ncbi:MAG: protein-L-isoaspartate O-methyltransferase [Patescibacteria group bacterium]|nr:protein-L-isoaspartate O-methyltransferase [Patescibacteria group bacterium]